MGRDIHKAHDSDVTSLCTLNGNRLLSSSGDCSSSIKVWNIFDSEMH